MKYRFVVWILGIAIVVGSSAVFGQSFPTKAIRIVTNEPGGNADFTTRIVVQGLTNLLGQPMVVDNRSSIVAIETVMRAAPDGYTLLYGSSTFIYAPLLRKMFYDPLRDFSPISMLTKQPSIVVVPASVPATSIKEFIALAKAKPGQLNFASLGVGSATHLAAELFDAMAGIKMVHIPYKGLGAASTDVISGRVQFMITSAQAATPLMKSGKLKALAVTTAQPTALVPGLPTVADSGLPGYVWESTNGIYAPAKTPAAVARRLNQEIVRTLNIPEIRQKFLDAGAETVASSPAEFAARLKSETVRLGKVIKDAGIQAD